MSDENHKQRPELRLVSDEQAVEHEIVLSPILGVSNLLQVMQATEGFPALVGANQPFNHETPASVVGHQVVAAEIAHTPIVQSDAAINVTNLTRVAEGHARSINDYPTNYETAA